MGCAIPWMGWSKLRQSRSFVSRAELCSALGDVEESQDGFLQQAARSDLRVDFYCNVASASHGQDITTMTAENSPATRKPAAGCNQGCGRGLEVDGA